MNNIEISLKRNDTSYPIYIGESLFPHVAHFTQQLKPSRIAVITDENLALLWTKDLLQAFPTKISLIVVPAGENWKNLEQLEYLWRRFYEEQLDRSSLILNLGGGAILDMGGFAASTYMRGLPFIHLPTTLLAQIDASIGGKVAINFAGVKNLLGAFVHPKAVFCDIATLDTLPQREFWAGFAEMLKIALIEDASFLQKLEKFQPSLEQKSDLIPFIQQSCRLKKAIVQRDELEKGERKLLNFGHTVGHAIEAFSWKSKTPLLHGEAISLGMLVETALSIQLGYLDQKDFFRLQELFERYHLPTTWQEKVSAEELWRWISFDKKRGLKGLEWTLLEKLGKGLFGAQISKELFAEIWQEFLLQGS